MKKQNIEVEGGELLIQSKEGHYAVIPAKHRQEVMDMVKDGCDDCINNYIQTLPKDSDYAEDGSLYSEYLTTDPPTKKTTQHPLDPNPDGSLPSYFKGSDANPIQLDEVTVTAEAPEWLKYRKEYVKNNPFNIDEYVESRYNAPVGREAIKKIDGDSWRKELRQEGLRKRQQELDEATKMGLLYQRFNPQDKDDIPIADEQFKKRYGTSPHRYRYDNDPEYRKYYEQVAREATSKIDYPSTDLRRKDVVAPNNMWMYPNLTGESKAQATNFSNEVIGIALPIPVLESMGKIPSVFKAGKNLIKHGIDKSATSLIKKGVGSTGELLNKSVQNAYKLNPWAFKPSSNNLYRGLGESGVKDAFETGVLRPRPAELRHIGKDIVTDSGKTFRLKGKTFDKTYYSPEFKIADRYGNGYIAEVPKNSATFNNRYSTGKDWSMHTTEQISIDKANILKKDWLRGYKKINAPKKQFKSEIDWGKWNKEIPNDKEIMREYEAIEKMLNETKSFGINPVTNKPYSVDINVPKEIDIVLRSKNFKKSFPDFNFDTDAIYRGERWARKNYINKDRPTDAVFGTSDFKGAASYVKRQNTEDIIHPHKIDEVFKEYNIKEDELIYNDGSVGGINVLAIPNKSKTFRVDAKNNKFTVLPNDLKLNQEYVENNTQNLKDYIKRYGKDEMKISKDYNNSKLYASIDNYASALNDGLKDYNRVLVENVYDGIDKPIPVHIINPRNTPIKSIFYNNGKFDLTNPNIYKSVLPVTGASLLLKSKTNKDEKGKR